MGSPNLEGSSDFSTSVGQETSTGSQRATCMSLPNLLCSHIIETVACAGNVVMCFVVASSHRIVT
eukprot:2622957-Amphidinium_carterae.1